MVMQKHASTPLYAEHLHFLVTRAGWLVTKIFQHFTFEQSKFKKDFVVLNQKSRQKATFSVERDFCKLLNNANFGIDCRNNINDCYFELIYDEIAKISYIKKFEIIFDSGKYHDFCDIELMKEEVGDRYNGLILALDPSGPTYEARKYSL